MADSSIRVDVDLLDTLMNLVGELVLVRNQILQYSTKGQDSTLTATSQYLNPVTTELQEEVMKTRMQQIGKIWDKFPRVMRDLSIAVFGPKRMDYKNIFTIVNHTAKKVLELLSERKLEFQKTL